MEVVKSLLKPFVIVHHGGDQKWNDLNYSYIRVIILTLKQNIYLFKRIIIIVITLDNLSPIKRSRILEAKSGMKKSKPHIVER